MSIDSFVYKDGKLVEQIWFDYEYNSGRRSIYSSLNDGKVFVQTDYIWDYEIKSWVPETKDSLVYSTSVNFDGHLNRYTTDFLSEYTYNYHNSTWVCSDIFTKVNTECTPTNLVIAIKHADDSADSFDLKLIYKFRSTDWSEKNLAESIIQAKSSISGYYTTYKSVYDDSARYDYEIGRNDTLVCTEKHYSYKDSHLNDTLTVDLLFNGAVWDTARTYRYKLIYDSNGNNIISIESCLDKSTGNWRMFGKYVSYYSQVSSTVIHSVLSPSDQDFSTTLSLSAIHFFAPDIKGVDLYDIKGRKVRSIRKQASSVLTIGTAGSALRLSSGRYFARVICEKRTAILPLLIR